MSVCSICRFQITDNTTKVCPNCGAPIKPPQHDDDDDYISEQNELSAEANSDFEPIKGLDNNPPPDEDSIQICDPGDLLYGNEESFSPQASNNDGEANTTTDEGPIGQTTPPPPEPVETPDNTPNENQIDTGSLRKLSDEQVESIRSDLLHPDEEYVSPNDAAEIMHNLATESAQNNKNDDNKPEISQGESETGEIPISDTHSETPPSPPSDTPPPKEGAEIASPAPPMRRVAYFHKNFIQLTGPFHPASGEEIIIGERYYLLKPKKIKTQYAITAFAAALLIVLFFIGRQFISPTIPGQGTVIGMILDEDSHPFINGIEIRMPESGKKVITDPQGFFRFDGIAPGVYKLSYTLADGYEINEPISVIDGEITMLTLGGKTIAEHIATPEPKHRQTTPRHIEQQAAQSMASAETTAEPNAKSTKKESANSSSKKKYSALKLKTNVKNAKLKVGTQVLGVGNLTYRKLAPGKHKVRVSKEGYKTWRGYVTLKPGKTYSLKVNLKKITTTAQNQEKKPETPTYTAEDFYQSGKTMLADGNATAAIGDFSEAITLSPSMADAYVSRAEAYLATKNKSAAENDYVHAGEIYMSKKRSELAYKMFHKALKINKKSIAAMLNIADYYKRKDNRSEALRYYKNVLHVDKNNFKANLEAGKLYFAMGKNRDADKRLRKAKEANPRDPQVYHYLMLNYFARDDFKNVKKTYAQFKDNTTENDVDAFKTNMKYDAILRIVGEYKRP